MIILVYEGKIGENIDGKFELTKDAMCIYIVFIAYLKNWFVH